MRGTTTDRFTEQQARIDRQRQKAAAQYPSLFARLSAGWNSPDLEDCAWLTYAANYVFRTAGVRWAIDPLSLPWRIPEAPAVEVGEAFKQCDFIMLTHRHADHLDLDLVVALQRLPIRWVIPEFLLEQVLAAAPLPEERIIVPHSRQAFDLCGVRIVPFDGQHWDELPDAGEEPKGVPAMGYLVESHGKRWLFPGDTRSYHAELLPRFGPVEALFAHVWLGRGSALIDRPPLLEPFCRFCLALQPKRVILAHLQEFVRAADDFWDSRHAGQITACWQQLAPEIPISAAYMGERICLDPEDLQL